MIVWMQHHARKVIAAVIGVTLIVVGAVVLVTPLPLGIVLMPLGLVVLATEFVWARWWLRRIERKTGPFGRTLRKWQRDAKRWWKQRSSAADAA